MTRRRILCKILMLVLMAAVCVIGKGKASITILTLLLKSMRSSINKSVIPFIYSQKHLLINSINDIHYKKPSRFIFNCFLILIILISFSTVALAACGDIVSVSPNTFTAGKTTEITVKVNNCGSSTEEFEINPTMPSGWAVDDRSWDGNDYQRRDIGAYSNYNFIYDITPPNNGGSGEIKWELSYYKSEWIGGSWIGADTYYQNVDAPKVYTLEVKSNQKGASVSLDDTYKCTTSGLIWFSCSVSDVSSGPHTVKLTKSGYNDASKSVSVTSDTSVTVDMSEKTYSVSISSAPTGAAVYFNDNFKGYTP